MKIYILNPILNQDKFYFKEKTPIENKLISYLKRNFLNKNKLISYLLLKRMCRNIKKFTWHHIKSLNKLSKPCTQMRLLLKLFKHFSMVIISMSK